MIATIPDWMGGPHIPIPSLIAFYLAQTSASSQRTILILLAGIILIIIGIATFAVGFKATTEAEEVSWSPEPAVEKYRRKPQPVVKEVIKEREIVYIRCSYCGAKALETEKKCPNCGANL